MVKFIDDYLVMVNCSATASVPVSDCHEDISESQCDRLIFHLFNNSFFNTSLMMSKHWK